MIRMLFIWLLLFGLTFVGIGTWRKWKLEVAFNWSKIGIQAAIAATIVTLFLIGVVILF